MIKTIVCIAGLSQDAIERVQAEPARFTREKGNVPIMFPMRPPFIYTHDMSSRYLGEACRRARLENGPIRARVVLVYIDHGESAQSLLEAFYPYALVSKLEPFHPLACEKRERNHRLKEFLKRLERTTIALIANSRQVSGVFEGDNFSPILLPLRNFKSASLSIIIQDLFKTLGTSPTPIDDLERAKSALRKDYPVIRQKGAQPYVVDEGGLRFASPGSNRHGFAQMWTKPHNPGCFLSSRSRLGGAFDPLFHYDCSRDGSSAAGRYPNCHNEVDAVSRSTHVNIAPSDAIR